MILDVYVPVQGTHAATTIRPGSAVVGSPSGARVRIDYEGNLYGSADDSFEQRLLLAADRHVHKSPTIARMTVEADDVIRVGTYDTEKRALVVESPTLLDAYRRHGLLSEER